MTFDPTKEVDTIEVSGIKIYHPMPCRVSYAVHYFDSGSNGCVWVVGAVQADAQVNERTVTS